ncbi:molybdenum cofactor biosynthesis protein 1-like isoform X2 [Maniola jurtina]|uniref:molybdenum cofactor biosynthesis protein 1-like isoform X2 n=1 Tax=Maniola jurtina TaxID=191418 RepID=UPI001E686C6C|nr:molybdenum cofactor biosynthesis protein 1-like isoform X2 [Maniola jurtina]
MPAEGVRLSARSALLSRDELLRLARVFAALGVRKLRLTGGEPTLRADLLDVVRAYTLPTHGPQHHTHVSQLVPCAGQYCMPAEGVRLSARSALLSRDELLRLARVFAALGVRKLRLTGGEPTLRADLLDVVRAYTLPTHGPQHHTHVSQLVPCAGQYCMPAEGVRLSARSALLSRDELLRLARVFAALGVRKLRLTGGEPTLRADLLDVVRAYTLPTHGPQHHTHVSQLVPCAGQYCMPAEGVRLSARSALLSRDELLRLARVFAALGVRKLRLTGGEPTLRADLLDVVRAYTLPTHGPQHHTHVSQLVPCAGQYCMPAEGVRLSARSALLSRDELLRLARVFAALGVRKLRLTGGEPTLRADLLDVVRAYTLPTHGPQHHTHVSQLVPCAGQYCMPAEGVRLSARSALLSRDELLRLARVFAALGVRKLRLTGGEPTLRADLLDVVQGLSELRGVHTVAMTSNGLALTRRLPALQRAGLSALNLSLDSLRAERFERMARRPGLSHVLASLDLALQLGLPSVKINTVLMKGFNDDEICDFVELTKDREVDVRFIEFMPFAGNKWQDSRMVSERAALDAVRRRHPALRAAAPAPCRTATVCLFGAAETNMRDALRGGADAGELAELVRGALRRKHKQHAAAPQRVFARGLCSRALTHVDAEGQARMVDVGDKPVTRRSAEAECFVRVSARVVRLLRAARLPKGDALTVAQVAGLAGAKRAAELLPLCHPLPLEHARVRLTLPSGDGGGRVRLACECAARARTGVEMEALTGCAVAALALYDMCKAVDKAMVVEGLRVVRKAGGSSDWPPPAEPLTLRAHDTSPLKPDETYAPTDVVHF